ALQQACRRDGIDPQALVASVLGSDTRQAVRTFRERRRASKRYSVQTTRRQLTDALTTAQEGGLPVSHIEQAMFHLDQASWPDTPPVRRPLIRRQEKRELAVTERRLLVQTFRALIRARQRRSPNADARTLQRRATEYAFVVLSLNGPSLYPATADDL